MRIVMLLIATLLAASGAAADTPCSASIFEGSRFEACRFDLRSEEMRLTLIGPGGAPLRGFQALSASLGRKRGKVLFAMNAGMFDALGAPIGLYVENGMTRHSINRAPGDGNFYMQPNGVFSLGAGGMRLDTTAAYAPDGKPAWATQSGPMLLIDGKLTPPISEDGPSRYIRNAVCVLSPKDAVFVISNDAVSFGRLARFMRDTLKCRDALYFDGAVSSAWIPSLKRMDDHAPLGPMVVVLAR